MAHAGKKEAKDDGQLSLVQSLEEKAAHLKAELSSSSLPLSWAKEVPSGQSDDYRDIKEICLAARLELFDLMLLLTPLVKSWMT